MEKKIDELAVISFAAAQIAAELEGCSKETAMRVMNCITEEVMEEKFPDSGAISAGQGKLPLTVISSEEDCLGCFGCSGCD